ncbi:tetratricopeptide repeat protein [Agrococcus sp. SCSIO52902]|uniref:tetratricopeptide repeat protein n=1 Tax=Agrococcus sp. SCSIO52902 TaxID=2933290 RepID=UPI001FF3494D|nr:tetratricopeptide repeat protein [Agrococcus sp. SCSIO52902]UOV99938.1 tetratricopeptide repeat protein [Agrococcus sp. SCSIO52902]
MIASAAEWERRVAALWVDEAVDDEARIAAMRALAAEAPELSAGLFELAGAHDAAGRERQADALYRAAVEEGLPEADPAREAQRVVQHASTLRNLGRLDEAIALLEGAAPHPSTGAGREAFLALALHSAGRHDEALRVALEALGPTLPRYRTSVLAYAAELTPPPA